jgi:hypothetical protein
MNAPTQRPSISAVTRVDAAQPVASLPPTRAARPARSRGAFLAGRGERGLFPGFISLLCIAVTAVSLLAIAPRLIDAAVLNPALELVATTSQLPVAVSHPRH